MREILFRAKRKSDLEWIEGYYVKLKDRHDGTDVHLIVPTGTFEARGYDSFDYEEVIPETVCQFMNDHDIDNVRMFEFDVIECYDNYGKKFDAPPLVVTNDRGSFCSETGLGRWRPHGYNCKVIGNTFDNPELLKGHGMSHFVCGMGTVPDDYSKQHSKLTAKYGIHGAHAGCYLENYESEYVCHQYNGGCPRFHECQCIHEEEQKKDETIHAKWIPMKVYPTEFVCSRCGEFWPDKKVDVCPECKAVMDADTGNEKGE